MSDPGLPETSVTNLVEPDANPVREKALTLIGLARKPKLIVRGGNAVEDSDHADREATLALAAAMVYLADTLRGSQ